VSSRRFSPAGYTVTKLYEQKPDVFKAAKDDMGASLYHHLLQKLLIDWMGMLYRGSWQTEILVFESATGREMRYQPAQPTAPEPSVILTTDEITKRMTGNMFAGIYPFIPPQIALPPDAQLVIKPPTRQGVFETAEIVIKNRFCTISIVTEQAGWIRSIGSYARLARLSSEESAKYGTANYNVRFKAEFSRLYSGNPEMPKYKRWARQLLDGMKAQFDEQTIWEKTWNDYLFFKETAERPPLWRRLLAFRWRKD